MCLSLSLSFSYFAETMAFPERILLNFGPIFVLNCCYIYSPRWTSIFFLIFLETSHVISLHCISASKSHSVPSTISFQSMIESVLWLLDNFRSYASFEKICFYIIILITNSIISTKLLFLLLFNLLFLYNTSDILQNCYRSAINYGKMSEIEVRKRKKNKENIDQVLITSDIDLEIPKLDSMSDAERESEDDKFPIKNLNSMRLKSYSTRFLNSLDGDDYEFSPTRLSRSQSCRNVHKRPRNRSLKRQNTIQI